MTSSRYSQEVNVEGLLFKIKRIARTHELPEGCDVIFQSLVFAKNSLPRCIWQSYHSSESRAIQVVKAFIEHQKIEPSTVQLEINALILDENAAGIPE